MGISNRIIPSITDFKPDLGSSFFTSFICTLLKGLFTFFLGCQYPHKAKNSKINYYRPGTYQKYPAP